MLFYGPPGTGKTSTILALAKELYGPTLAKSRVLELNASDERGISIVREKVKTFARMSISQASGADRKDHPCPPYKIVILDEADSMTSDAQSALRRTMELYSKTTRFCLICNYVTRIIDPIASRCAKFRFKPLDETNAIGRLEYIATQEELNYEPGVLEALLKASEGDLRKAITFLQSAARLTKAPKVSLTDNDTQNDDEDVVMTEAEVPELENKIITIKSIQEIAGVIPDSIIEGLVESCKSKAYPKKSFGEDCFDNIMAAVQEVILDGWSATQILTQLHDRLMFDDLITAKQKNEISWQLSESDKRLADGTDEHLEILNTLTKFAQVIY